MGETEHGAEKALVIAQCERRLLRNSNKIAKLRGKVRDLTTERDRLTEDVDALREHIGQLARSCDNRDALIEETITERDRLRGERDTLWDRAHDRGVAIEHARNRLHALADQHEDVRGELLAIADRLWASMQDAVPADARGEVMYDVQMTSDEAAEIDVRRDARGERERAVWAIKHIRAIHEAWCDPTDQGERTVGDRVGEALIALMNDPALWDVLDAPPAGRGKEVDHGNG